MNIKGTHCWEAVGPAGDAMKNLYPHVSKLLEENQDRLEEGEDKPSVIGFNMWMEGKTAASSQPIIVFSSKSRRQRTRAKELLKESQLLTEYPGIKVKALDKMPAIYAAGGSDQATLVRGDILNDICVPQNCTLTCGAPIYFGGSRLATLMGVIKVGDEHYGLTAQHARFRSPRDVSLALDKDEALAFDDDSDEESEDDAEATSKASESGSSSTGTDTLAPPSSDEDIFDPPQTAIHIIEPPVTLPIADETTTDDPLTNLIKIATVSEEDTPNDLDYQLLHFDAKILTPAHIQNPVQPFDCLSSQVIAKFVTEASVLAATSKSGIVKGVIMSNSHYIKMEYSSSYQELWSVKLERDIISGDCGSLVIGAETGYIYGHIVAADPTSGLAYIIPTYKVFDDIEHRFGCRPVFAIQSDLEASLTSQSSPAFHLQNPPHDSLRDALLAKLRPEEGKELDDAQPSSYIPNPFYRDAQTPTPPWTPLAYHRIPLPPHSPVLPSGHRPSSHDHRVKFDLDISSTDLTERRMSIHPTNPSYSSIGSTSEPPTRDAITHDSSGSDSEATSETESIFSDTQTFSKSDTATEFSSYSRNSTRLDYLNAHKGRQRKDPQAYADWLVLDGETPHSIPQRSINETPMSTMDKTDDTSFVPPDIISQTSERLTDQEIFSRFARELRERKVPLESNELDKEEGRTDDRWTEIAKHLVSKKALKIMGYEYKETEAFYYVIAYLRYEEVQDLVELSKKIELNLKHEGSVSSLGSRKERGSNDVEETMTRPSPEIVRHEVRSADSTQTMDDRSLSSPVNFDREITQIAELKRKRTEKEATEQRYKEEMIIKEIRALRDWKNEEEARRKQAFAEYEAKKVKEEKEKNVNSPPRPRIVQPQGRSQRERPRYESEKSRSEALDYWSSAEELASARGHGRRRSLSWDRSRPELDYPRGPLIVHQSHDSSRPTRSHREPKYYRDEGNLSIERRRSDYRYHDEKGINITRGAKREDPKADEEETIVRRRPSRDRIYYKDPKADEGRLVIHRPSSRERIRDRESGRRRYVYYT